MPLFQKSPYRAISREVRQGLRDEMKQHLNSEEGQKCIAGACTLLKLSLVFEIQPWLYRFLLRGLEKVKAEFTLMCLAYNLRKLAKHAARFLLFWLTSTPFWGMRPQNSLLNPVFQRTWAERIANGLYAFTHGYMSPCVPITHSRSAC
ncbi:MAG: transposase [Lewinellaceae bacterium]|nr:transposase [Lewinellaceae bacterium]